MEKIKIKFEKQGKKFNLDLKQYMDRHNLIYRSKIEKPEDGLPVVTGKCGAVVWHKDNGLCMQINNVDGSPQTQFSSGQVFIESEALFKPGGSSLNLYSGEGVFDFENGQVKITGGNADSYFAVSVTVKRRADFKITLSMWDKQDGSPVSYRAYVKNPADWRAFTKINGGRYTGIRKESRSSAENSVLVSVPDVPSKTFKNTADETIFGFCTAIGTDSAVQTIAEDGVISLTADKFTLYIANPSKFESGFNIGAFYNKPPSYEEIYSQNAKFWEEFWSRRFLCFTEEGEEGRRCYYLESMYYLSQYMFEGAMLGRFPMHFINGNLRSDRDDGLKWSCAYWWYNQRCLYGGMLASGNVREVKTFLDFYYNNLDRFAADTKNSNPGSSGFTVPETAGWDGNRFFCECPYVKTIHDTTIQIALLFYKYYLFTQDKKDLERFLTFGRGAAEYYITSVLTNAGSAYVIPAGRSHARETYWGIANPITDLAGIRALFPLLAKHCRDKIFTAELRNIVRRLAPYEIGGCPERYLGGKDIDKHGPYNHDDPVCELLYPLDFAYGKKDAYLMNNAFEYRNSRNQTQGCISWDNGAIWAARLFRGDEMRDSLADKIAKNQKNANGTGTDGNCVYEINGVLITALNESMLDCRGGIIRVFAAMPKNRRMRPFFRLHAPGGFIVSSEWEPSGGCSAHSELGRLSNCAKYIVVEAVCSGLCRLYNPWRESRNAVIENLGTGEKTVSDKKIISFKIKKGETYFIAPEGVEFECEAVQIIPPQEKIFNYNGHTCRLGN